MEASVRLSHRYIPARQLPDKSVSLLDTACARVAISQHAVPAEMDDCRKKIESLQTELEIIGREESIGIDTVERKARVDGLLGEEQERQEQLEERWKSEKKLVDQILDLRRQLREVRGKVDEESEEVKNEVSGEGDADTGEPDAEVPAGESEAVEALDELVRDCFGEGE